MKQLLLSEKYRPKKIQDVILLPRIHKIFENGLTQNVILHGHFGTGKTTLARILIGKYSKDKPFIELNSSFYTSIDTLREKIDSFCSRVYMGFDVEDTIKSDSMKYVFLDEFERTSSQYQDALKAYIEEYSAKNVRFILNTNHINKISPGIRSRFIEVNFDVQSIDEERFLKGGILKKIMTEINPNESFEVAKEELVKIINKKFPDIRSIMIELDNLRQTGETSISTSNTNAKLKLDLYNLIYDKSRSYEDIYHWLMNNFGDDKIDEMMLILGRPFIEWTINEKGEDMDKLFKANYIITENTRLLETNTDPIVLGMTVIGKLRDIFKTEV